MKKRMMIYFLPMLLGLSGCEDDSDSLPPITQTGANTFGCKINGEVWSVSGGGQKNNIGADWVTNTLVISGNSGNGFGIKFTIETPLSEQSQVFEIKDENIQIDVVGGWEGCLFETEDITKGMIYIDYVSLEKRIISGRFDLSAFKECKGEIILTEGRFDIPRLYY